jgi:hypothetical protein
MRRGATLVALAALLAAGPGCDASGGGTNGTDGPESGGSAGTGGSASPPTGPLTPDSVATRCPESRLMPPRLRRLTRSELEGSIRQVFGLTPAQWSGTTLGPDPTSALKFSNDANVLVIGGDTAKNLLKTAKRVAELVASPTQLATLLPCSSSAADQACASDFIRTFGKRLYRRALTSEEQSELEQYYASVASRSSFELGIKWTLVALLQSPALLYRSELGDAAGTLTQTELATELSYTYGGVPPSDELLASAERGELTPTSIATLARTLAASERGHEQFQQFFREWLAYERVLGQARDNVAQFAAVGQAMVEETRRFIDEVTLTNAGGVGDLLKSPVTFVDPTLAAFYGFGASSGGFTRVDRPAQWGVGILAQGSFLAGNAHPTHSSPVFRGALVASRFLCRVPPKPPADVPPIPATGTANTTRERYEKLHAVAGRCHDCHATFEPFGFALEHFDESGRYRDNENGFPIDAAASAPVGDTTVSFDGLNQLATQLADSPEVTDCASGLLTAYVFAGSGGEVCLAEEQRAALLRADYGLAEFYLQLASAPSITRRAR